MIPELLEKIGLQRQIDEIKESLKGLKSWKEVMIKEKIESLMLIRKIMDKVDKISEDLSKHLMEYEVYRNKYFVSSQKPYKCPVCEGKGRIILTPKCEMICHPCEGKGIVWR